MIMKPATEHRRPRKRYRCARSRFGGHGAADASGAAGFGSAAAEWKAWGWSQIEIPVVQREFLL